MGTAKLLSSLLTAIFGSRSDFVAIEAIINFILKNP